MDPLGHVVTSLYYADGQLWATVNPLGCCTTCQYDGANRQTAFTNALGQTSQSVYYEDGQLWVSIDPLLRRTTYTYDGRTGARRLLMPKTTRLPLATTQMAERGR